jgi:hypothetical protein
MKVVERPGEKRGEKKGMERGWWGGAGECESEHEMGRRQSEGRR